MIVLIFVRNQIYIHLYVQLFLDYQQLNETPCQEIKVEETIMNEQDGEVRTFDYIPTVQEYSEELVEALRKKTGFDSSKALENSVDENGELQVAETPKRRVTSIEDKPTRRVPEYKIITDN